MPESEERAVGSYHYVYMYTANYSNAYYAGSYVLR